MYNPIITDEVKYEELTDDDLRAKFKELGEQHAACVGSLYPTVIANEMGGIVIELERRRKNSA